MDYVDLSRNVKQLALSPKVAHILISCPPFVRDFCADACPIVKQIALAAQRNPNCAPKYAAFCVSGFPA